MFGVRISSRLRSQVHLGLTPSPWTPAALAHWMPPEYRRGVTVLVHPSNREDCQWRRRGKVRLPLERFRALDSPPLQISEPGRRPRGRWPRPAWTSSSATAGPSCTRNPAGPGPPGSGLRPSAAALPLATPQHAPTTWTPRRGPADTSRRDDQVTSGPTVPLAAPPVTSMNLAEFAGHDHHPGRRPLEIAPRFPTLAHH
jgi:hypothetical protein